MQLHMIFNERLQEEFLKENLKLLSSTLMSDSQILKSYPLNRTNYHQSIAVTLTE